MVVGGNLKPGVLVRITRRHTIRGNTPYKSVGFFAFPPPDHADGNGQEPVEFPESWSSELRDPIARHCFVREGIAADLAAVPEEDVPRWLWRHEPADVSLQSEPLPRINRGKNRGETSLRQVIDRMVGAWTYHGWKGGYFDTEEDARTYFDEMRWLICQQRLSPPIAQWRNAGLHWAYGLRTDEPNSFVTDYRTGAVRRAEAGDMPPHGIVINGTHGAMAGEGGVWDLWEREGRILSLGGQCGVNVSNIAANNPDSNAAGNVLSDILHMGEAAGSLVRDNPSRGGQKRRITIDASHPHAQEMAERPLADRGISDAAKAGLSISIRHIQAIIEAATDLKNRRRSSNLHSATLRFAIQSARQAHLPERLIQHTLACLDQGAPVSAEAILGIQAHDGAVTTGTRSIAPDNASSSSITVFQMDNETINSSSPDGSKGSALMDAIARNGWAGIPSGLQFEGPANDWNTCPDSGSIQAAAGDGGFLFLDDTASAPAFLNTPAFLEADGTLDPEAFAHATTLLTIAQDVSLMIATQPTPRLAKRVWDFRPLSLSPMGLASLLMAMGLAYDSPQGRAFGRAVCALITGTAYHTSARMAEELGSFPAYAHNALSMGRVLQRHADTLSDELPSNELPSNDIGSALSDHWQRAIRAAWQCAQQCGQETGFRNAQVSLITEARSEAVILDCDSPGLSPSPALVYWRRNERGDYEKTLSSSVIKGLKSLGYSDAQTDAILCHVLGRGTLKGAPGVNHETLKKRGFTNAALRSIEAALATTQDISLVFNSGVLGEHYCIHMLGFAPNELQDDTFDMLAALGFSDAGIEAANVYCCGAHTVEGAPYLAPDHVAVFDCAENQGDRGSRHVSPQAIIHMMAAVQPALSGAIAHMLTLPAAATTDDCRDVIMLAWRSGLKALVFACRQEDKFVPETDGRGAEHETNTLFTIVEGGQSPQRIEASEASQESEVASHTHYELAVTDREETQVGDAETPRRATSLPTQSTASVTSSADAVVEQRQV